MVDATHTQKKGLDELGVCDGDIIMLNSTTAGVIPSSSQANTTQQDRHYAQLQPSTMPQINWGSVVIPPNVASSISRTSTASSTAPSSQAQFPPMLQSQASEPSGLPFDPETLVQHLLTNPEELAALQQRNPQMAEAILSGDPDLVAVNIQAYRQQLMVSTSWYHNLL